MGKILRLPHIPHGLDHCLWKLVTIGILNGDRMISHKIEEGCSLGDPKDM